MILRKFRELIRRDWKTHKRPMIIQIITGLLSGFSIFLYVKTQDLVFVGVFIISTFLVVLFG